MLFKEGRTMRKVAVIMGARAICPSPRRRSRRSRNMGSRPRSACYPPTGCPNEAREFAASARESRIFLYHRARGHGRALGRRDGREYDASCHRRAVQRARSLTAWTRCYPPCRCPAGCLWRRLPSTAGRTPPCWRCRSWRWSDEGLLIQAQKPLTRGTAVGKSFVSAHGKE